MTVISVQSHVASGHVGNAAAEYPLRRLGFDVACVHTTLLAHHPGHGAVRGGMVASETVHAVLAGLDVHGVFARSQALLTGYLGSTATGEVVAAAWDAIRRASPAALYCCQTVIGDATEGVYVAAELPALFRDLLVPRAGVVIANAFEAGLLAGVDVNDADSARYAAAAIRAKGPSIVIVTSVPLADAGGARLGNLLDDEGAVWLTAVRKLDIAAKGTGDFLSALWLGRYLTARDPVAALAEALAVTQAAVGLAHARAAAELPIADVIDQPAPSAHPFAPQRI